MFLLNQKMFKGNYLFVTYPEIDANEKQKNLLLFN